MVEENMGTDAAEELGEAKIVKEHKDTGEVEIGKVDGDMGKTETVEDIGKVGGEDVRKADTESTGEDVGIEKTEKMEEDVVKMESEKVDEGMENTRTEKVDEDLGKEETEKMSEDMGKEEDEKTVDDMGRPDVESTEEDMRKAEIEKEDENVVKPMEEDNKEDGQTVVDHVVKEPDENKLEEQNDSEDSDKDEETLNEENEAEAQVTVGRKRPRKRSNREQAKEDVAKSLEEDHREDGGTATDRDLKESEGNKLEEHHDSDGSDKEGEKTDEEKEAEAKLSMGRKRPRKQSNKGQAKEEAKEPISPAVHIDRPVRERKSVERLVASIEKEPAREFLIPKGRGTALKDIPNVAHKLSRKKNEDTVKMLHVILFGRRGKATHVKSNVSQFSGFVWHENEEKQRSKMKEKLDKLVKEKLLEFCDVFDIPVLKATVKKEDIVTKLLDFLAAPHPKGDAVVAEKEKLGSVKKRSRIVKESGPNSGDASAKNSSKKQRKNEGSPTLVGEEFDSDSEDGFDRSEPVNVFEEEEDGQESVPDRSDDEVGGHSESKGKGSDARDVAEVDIKKQNMSVQRSTNVKSPTRNKSKKMTTGKEETRLSSPKKRHISKHPKEESRKEDGAERENSILNGSEDEAGEHSESLRGKGRDKGESEEETTNQNQSSKRSSSKKATPVTGKPKKVATTGKEAPVRSPKISPSTIRSKVNDNGDKAAVVFSRKKKNQETSIKKPTVPLKPCSKENDSKRQSGEKSVLEKNVTMKDSCAPSEQELRKVICEILSEVDLNKATFIDILKQLGQHFQMDLEPRKSLIKIMVKEELIKLNDDDDDEDEDDEDDEESDNEKEKPRSAVREVRKTKPPPINSAASVDEENRCRRSDGKKWRCSKEVVNGQKYCEHHLHRGKIKKR